MKAPPLEIAAVLATAMFGSRHRRIPMTNLEMVWPCRYYTKAAAATK